MEQRAVDAVQQWSSNRHVRLAKSIA